MYWTDSQNWAEIAKHIEQERRIPDGYKYRPIPTDISNMLYGIEERFKSGIGVQERKDMAELLFQIYIELNTEKPIGRDYKRCFMADKGLIDQFIEVFKMVNENFTIYYSSVLDFLEDFKGPDDTSGPKKFKTATNNVMKR